MVVQVRCGYLVVRDVNSFVPTCLHTVYVIYCASKLHVFQWSCDTQWTFFLCVMCLAAHLCVSTVVTGRREVGLRQRTRRL